MWKIGKSDDVRQVILHYHLFKNAGTSLDESFKANFKPREWVTREFPPNPVNSRKQLHNWIKNDVKAKCFSSHTALLPPPRVNGVQIFPVIFVRHPIDRIASVYEFERRQGSDTFGSVLARNTDLSGYVEVRLSRMQDFQCRNFHITRFAAMFPVAKGNLVERANEAVKSLPFVGVVSRFDQSLDTLERALQGFGFAGLSLQSTQENVSRRIDITMDEKLEDIRSRMSPAIYQSLVDANREDIELFETVSSRL